LYGPATAVIFTSGLTSRTAAWPSAVAAVLVFLLFAGTGLALSARAGFDHLIHAPARLRACAALDPVREIEFGALQALLGISKSALSKHVSALTDAGYVAQRRAVRDTRQRVWLCLTPAGRSAYRGHVAALHRIVGRAQAEPPNHEHPAEPDLTPATTS
jgi:DNA-binding MarR family transcriptional regulator